VTNKASRARAREVISPADYLGAGCGKEDAMNNLVAPNIKTNIPQDLPFYKVLQVLEQKKGLTEREVIERLELPRSTYRSWKDGTCEPSRRSQWRKLIQVFGINAEILIFGPRGKEHGNT